MCGIAGYYGFKFIDKKKLNITLSLMKNRGPDASGIIKKKLGKKKIIFSSFQTFNYRFRQKSKSTFYL